MKIVIICIFALCAMFLVAVVNSYYNNRHFEVTSYDVSHQSKGKEIKAVFITDLHSNSYGENNQRLLNAIRTQKPDLILIGGDMFVKDPEPDMTTALSFVEQLVQFAPVYYANGNHEKKVMDYWEESKDAFETYKSQLEKLGVTYLVNDSSVITYKGRNIEIAGLDLELRDYRKIWHSTELTVKELKEKIPKRKSSTDYRILLAHNPKYFDLYAKLDVELVLSGHVHGGIMILPVLGGVIAPDLRLFPKYDYGIFELGRTKMILSKGLGVHSIRLRVFNKPELTVFKI